MEKNILSYIRFNNINSDTSLVFLHGSTMTKEGIEPFARCFQDYSCVCMDLTAHGESGGNEPNSISQFASDVEYSITELQKKRVLTDKIVLFGYSMGGAIVCEIGIRRKIKVSGIVILSSGGDLKSNTPLVDELKKIPIEKFKTEDILQALFGLDTSEEQKEKIMSLFLKTKVKDEIGYKDLLVSNAYNELELCNQITVPTYIVHGSADKIVLPQCGITSCNAIRKSRIFIVPRKGHAAIFEEPQLISREICRFINEI